LHFVLANVVSEATSPLLGGDFTACVGALHTYEDEIIFSECEWEQGMHAAFFCSSLC
jgi:hypothetical protein